MVTSSLFGEWACRRLIKWDVQKLARQGEVDAIKLLHNTHACKRCSSLLRSRRCGEYAPDLQQHCGSTFPCRLYAVIPATSADQKTFQTGKYGSYRFRSCRMRFDARPSIFDVLQQRIGRHAMRKSHFLLTMYHTSPNCLRGSLSIEFQHCTKSKAFVPTVMFWTMPNILARCEIALVCDEKVYAGSLRRASIIVHD